MKVIGVCGKISSGKSTVSLALYNELRHKGKNPVVIYTDREFKEKLSKHPTYLKALHNLFGEEVSKNPEVFIKAMYNNPSEVSKLNIVTNMLMYPLIQNVIEGCVTFTHVIIESAYLLSTPLSILCDEIVYVTCAKNTRMSRYHKRDSHRSEDANAMLWAISEKHSGVISPFYSRITADIDTTENKIMNQNITSFVEKVANG
jgi:dephospho-CoA kinase